MRRRGHASGVILALLWTTLGSTAWAGPHWHFRKGLRVDTDWSGNVFLDDANIQRDLVIGIQPRFSINRKARRSRTSISYNPIFRYYTQGTHANRIEHRLTASSDVEVIRDLLGLRANAGISQRLVDRRQASAGDTVANPDNVTDTYTLRLSPYLRPQRLGRYAVLNAGLNFDLVDYSKSGRNTATGTVRDGRARSVNLSLRSGPFFSRTHWSLSSRRRLEIYKDRNDNTFGNILANLTYRLSRHWDARARLGYDQNDYESNHRTSGTQWGLGVGWHPNRRISGTFDFGRRYFGQDFNVSLTYRHRRSSLSLRLARDISTSLNDAGRNVGSPPPLAPLNAAQNAQGAQTQETTADAGQNQDNGAARQQGTDQGTGQAVNPFDIDTGAPDATDQVFIVDSYNLSYNLALRRSDLGLSLYHYRRDYQAVTAEPTDTGLRLSLSRNLTPKLSGRLNLGLTLHGNEPDPNLEYRQWAASLRFTRKLGEDTSLVFGYRFTKRTSEGSGGRDFSEDRLKLSIVNNGFFD